MSNSQNFTNKVVIVTGSSSGIGEDTAIHFAKLGANVVVTGRNAERIHKVALKCNALGHPSNTLEVVADLDKEENAKKLIDETIKTFGHLNVLVNSAAQFDSSSNAEEANAIPIYDKVMRTNLRNSFVVTHYAIPHLIKAKGAIVNVSSISSFKPLSNSMAHCMAKSALDMFTRCLAYDLGPRGVRVNSVNPAQIKTPVYENFGMTKEEIDSMWRGVSKKYPLRRPGEPEDVAKAIAFFASDDSSFATGVNFKLDGGYLDSLQLIFKDD